MQSSPLRSLVTRHLCDCKSSRSIVWIHSRSFAVAASRRVNFPAPSSEPVGSTELLRRRHQPKFQEKDKKTLDHERLKRRTWYAGYGIVACTFAILGTVYLYPSSSKGSVTHLDAPPSVPGVTDGEPAEKVEQIDTGTSSVPTFPKFIHFSELDSSGIPAADGGEQEYQLVGLGIRTVSFLSIQVYVVGMYVAVPDIATLQERLIRTVDPVATTLIPGERGKLKEALLDPAHGEDIWNNILKDGKLRTVFRIAPTRGTGFDHLRDGWVRGITGKTQFFAAHRNDDSFSDETFGLSLNDFKAMFSAAPRKNLPKGEVMLLTRDAKGGLGAWYEDKNGTRTQFGQLPDERISRLIWLLYLAGEKPSSEGARRSIVDGVMEYVERPVGTVAAQVV